MVERIVKNLRQNLPSPIDNRGKHHNRPNKLSDNICYQINTFTDLFPKRQSHYSRHDNANSKYMSPDFLVSKLYKMYLQKYEPEFWALFNNKDTTTNVKPQVKYNFFSKYFSSHFNISFSRPRSDTCHTCDTLKNSIETEQNVEEKASLSMEKELHLRKAEVFY